MPAVVGGRKETESSSEDEQEDHPCVTWSGLSSTIPVLLFLPEAVVSKDRNICSVGERYNLAFKIVRTESCVVRGILTNHGFHEVHPNSNDFNLMWAGSHLKPYVLRSLQDFQKVNHFPRSYELTRKDRLYRNIQRMQQTHGFRNFHIIPQTFVLPSEFQRFNSCSAKDGGPWIIKPVASSRGRGIYLVSNPSQVSVDDNILASRYINDPLLIDEFKFDVRLYVLVTSYDPLLIYVYEEGLARFATVKYDQTSTNIKNTFMHLTNYSLNKKSRDYVSCDDPEVEDYGNKWSMSAVLRYLKQEGKDTSVLMRKVEDVIIKAVLSAEQQIAAACRTFVPHKNNCFELYGFDVLIDSNLKPWLLEVNLSPSLSCDAPLDLKIKASMIADMFSLIGFVCQDPLTRQPRSDRVPLDKNPAGLRAPRQKRTSVVTLETEEFIDKLGGKHSQGDISLSSEEIKVLRRIKEEYERRGGFIRIFPTADTWELYGGYLESKTSMNSMLASRLFQGRNGNVQLQHSCHVVLYERKLLSLEARRRRRRHPTHRSAARRKKPGNEFMEVEEEHRMESLGKHEPRSEHRHGEAPSSSEAATPHATPTLSLLSILQEGWELSKVQARVAFSSYLHRVQQRLLAENQSCSAPAWPEKDDDQMELVVRFLRRAASNLQQDLKVVLPSRQLPVQDRRRMLAHQLGQFIHCYNKETELMVRKQGSSEEQRCVDSSVFQEYISAASESDLEEVLTFYTQKKKSATVFLGTKDRAVKKDLHDKNFPEDSGDAPSMAGQDPESSRSVGGFRGELRTMGGLCVSAADLPVEATAAKTRRSSSFPRTSGCAHNPASVPLHCPPPPPPQPPSYAQSLAKSHLCPSETPSDPPSYSSALISQRAGKMASSGSSSATSGQSGQVLRRIRSSSQSGSRATSSAPAAAHIYSQKLCRPPCTEPGLRKSGSSRVKSSSVGALRELQCLSAQAQSNQQAFISALQRLADKQAARHLTSSAHISLLTQHLSSLNRTNRTQNRNGFSLNLKAAAGQVGPVHCGKNHLSSSGLTLKQPPSSSSLPSPDARGASSEASASSHPCSSTTSV